MSDSRVEAIAKCLPQTQCTRCSYPCCTDYAKAIDAGEANINQCPPGGEVTIQKLAELTQQDAIPLNPEFGYYQAKTLAFIIEDKCIGCVLCIKACPVDAIVGANKRMHTVIQSNCTGCELCLPVCPTDCIKILPLEKLNQIGSDWPGYTNLDISSAKIRFEQRESRMMRLQANKTSKALGKIDLQQAILDAVRRKKGGDLA